MNLNQSEVVSPSSSGGLKEGADRVGQGHSVLVVAGLACANGLW